MESTVVVAGVVEEELSFVPSLTATFQSHWKTSRMHQDIRRVVAHSMLHLTSVPLQVGYLLLVAVMLVLRTYADVWMIQNGTAVEG